MSDSDDDELNDITINDLEEQKEIVRHAYYQREISESKLDKELERIDKEIKVCRVYIIINKRRCLSCSHSSL